MKRKSLILLALFGSGQLFAQQQDLLKVQSIKKTPQEYVNQGGELNDQLIEADQKMVKEVHHDFVIYRNSVDHQNSSVEQELKDLMTQANGDQELYDQLKQEWIKKNREAYHMMHPEGEMKTIRQ